MERRMSWTSHTCVSTPSLLVSAVSKRRFTCKHISEVEAVPGWSYNKHGKGNLIHDVSKAYLNRSRWRLCLSAVHHTSDIMQHIIPGFGRYQSSFGMNKVQQTMYEPEHAKYFHLGSLHLGQEGGQLPRFQNPTACGAKTRYFAWQRLFSKKSGPIWDIWESAMNLFLLKIYPELRHCEFEVRLTLHLAFARRLRRDQTIIFTVV